jgi:PadR family transcriptional regulator PadR
MSQDQELKKGSTSVLILAVLSDGPRHGYAIAREIERRSHEALSMGEGALYPALRALEREGMVLSEWETQPSGPARRIYTLTDAGQAKLASQIRAWNRFSQAVNDILGDANGGTPHAQPV